MEPNNTFTKYPGHELNPEKISSHGWQGAAYTPYGYNSQPTAAPGNYVHQDSTIDTVISCRSDTNYGTHKDTAPTRISYVNGGSTIDTVISCRSNTNYGMHSDTPSTRISSLHKSLDSRGWSSNKAECNYKRELTTIVTSNGYLHSSYPKSDASTNQVNRRTEYGRYKNSPSHQSETFKKFYTTSDKWSKRIQSPINKSQSSVSPKDRGRVRNRSIESSRGFHSGRSDKYFKLNNKREGTTTMISNERFHSLNPNYDKSTNQSNIRIEYDRYKRSPTHGRETSKKLYSHSDKSKVSPTSKPQKSVSPKDRKRKRTPTSNSPISSRSVKLASPVDLGRKRSPSIEPSRLVLRSREEKSLRHTRRKSLELRNNKHCERRSISPKQRSIRTVYPEGRRSSSPTSKSFNSRRSLITNRQRENAHSSSRTQSIHSQPRR